MIYFTDSSSRWGRRHVKLEVTRLLFVKQPLFRFMEEADGKKVKIKEQIKARQLSLSQVIELNDLGRLLSFDPHTGRLAVLLDRLYMPNGVALSPDEHFLLLAETSIGRILRYTRPIP